MARLGGRNVWIAVPASLLCAGVVGSLLWLSQPILPATAEWVVDAAQKATTISVTPPPAATEGRFASAEVADCRSLYPDRLWAELTWTPEALLSQDSAAPATAVAALTAALSPEIRVTCTWRAPAGSISTTVAAVGGDAVAIAEAALEGAGFACTSGQGLTCTRTRGAVVEEHSVRDGLWISSVETSWHPEDYGATVAATVWGG